MGLVKTGTEILTDPWGSLTKAVVNTAPLFAKVSLVAGAILTGVGLAAPHVGCFSLAVLCPIGFTGMVLAGLLLILALEVQRSASAKEQLDQIIGLRADCAGDIERAKAAGQTIKKGVVELVEVLKEAADTAKAYLHRVEQREAQAGDRKEEIRARLKEISEALKTASPDKKKALRAEKRKLSAELAKIS